MSRNISRPYGTLFLLLILPTDESVGYYRPSLRDALGYRSFPKHPQHPIRDKKSTGDVDGGDQNGDRAEDHG